LVPVPIQACVVVLTRWTLRRRRATGKGAAGIGRDPAVVSSAHSSACTSASPPTTSGAPITAAVVSSEARLPCLSMSLPTAVCDCRSSVGMPMPSQPIDVGRDVAAVVGAAAAGTGTV
jgi:hypothetical protein